MNVILLFLLAILPGQIYRISNLKDSGSGSLRECAEATGPRTCLFEISGAIPLKSNIVVTNPDLNILGQTAPELIELRGAGLHISASNVTVQHIAIRPGDSKSGSNPKTRDALQITNYKTKKPFSNVWVDHLSLTWSVDENLDIYGTTLSNIRVTNTLIAEGLNRSIHPEGPHGYGALINSGAEGVVFRSNLFAHNHDRNPRVKDAVTLQFISNGIYNWGGTSCWNSGLNLSTSSKAVGSLVNFVSNVYKGGPATHKRFCPSIYNDSSVPRSTRIYVRDNYGPTRNSASQAEWAISGLPVSMQSKTPLMGLPDGITPATEVTEYLVANVGAQPWSRPHSDSRIIYEFLRGEGDIKDCVAGCKRHTGGWDTLLVRVRPLTNVPTGRSEFSEWLKSFEFSGH